MSLCTKLMGRSTARPGAVPCVCLVLVLALLSVSCAGVTTRSDAKTSALSVSITAPVSGASVSGNIDVLARATDGARVARVEFYLDNSHQATGTSSPYAWIWNTTSAANGSHTIMAKAYDAAGNAATASVTVTANSKGGSAGLTPSGPITASGQTGVVIQGLHITNPNGDCVTITDSTNITIRQSEIGPCRGNGIVINNGNTINIFDNYIHPEGTLAGCCDVTDGIFANGTRSLTVQGNVIAYGESNIEAQNQTNITILGNFFLNPRNSGDRGQNIQVFYGSSSVLVENNYTLASVDTSRYKFAESQEDSINFGASTTGNFTSGIIARNNYITGGHSASGCGLIADTGANGAQFLSNTLVDTGQCGIGIANGKNHLVDSNKVLNSTPVSGGGNTAIYVWKVNSSDPHCGPVQISNNIASATAFDSSANSFWNGGGCKPVRMSNNTFDAAAQQALSPGKVKLPPPSVPPQPNSCVIASPFTNNVSLPACGSGGGGGTTPQTTRADREIDCGRVPSGDLQADHSTGTGGLP
jgi:Bacterial Ig domain/Right handed beta helix region